MPPRSQTSLDPAPPQTCLTTCCNSERWWHRLHYINQCRLKIITITYQFTSHIPLAHHCHTTASSLSLALLSPSLLSLSILSYSLIKASDILASFIPISRFFLARQATFTTATTITTTRKIATAPLVNKPRISFFHSTAARMSTGTERGVHNLST